MTNDLPTITGTAGATGALSGNTSTTTVVIDYRVWFADRSAVMVSAASEGEARMQAESIARRNGHAPHELGGRIASVEALP